MFWLGMRVGVQGVVEKKCHCIPAQCLSCLHESQIIYISVRTGTMPGFDQRGIWQPAYLRLLLVETWRPLCVDMPRLTGGFGQFRTVDL